MRRLVAGWGRAALSHPYTSAKTAEAWWMKGWGGGERVRRRREGEEAASGEGGERRGKMGEKAGRCGGGDIGGGDIGRRRREGADAAASEEATWGGYNLERR